ncbi:MAG: hypothetical protein ACKOCW_11160, partial [Planctomycetaceae bacterium]
MAGRRPRVVRAGDEKPKILPESGTGKFARAGEFEPISVDGVSHDGVSLMTRCNSVYGYRFELTGTC